MGMFNEVQTATILLGSTFTLINIVSSLRKCRFFSTSCDTKRGKPKPNESGSLLGRWKFFHVGSGMKLSTMLQAWKHIKKITHLFKCHQNVLPEYKPML